LAIHLLVDGEEGVAEGDIGERGGEAGAIAAGGGELLDGVRQRVREAVEPDDAGKLGARDALCGLFHQEVKHGAGNLGSAAGIVANEAGEGLDQAAAKYQALAGETILQVPRHGVGGHQEANGRIARERLAKAIQDVGGFAGAGGSREQPHRLQCSAGRRKIEQEI
jgi:hypothetical protein